MRNIDSPLTQLKLTLKLTLKSKMKRRFPLSLSFTAPQFISMLLALIIAPVWNVSIAQSTLVTLEQVRCAYNPKLGLPNPFGSRAFITVTQSGGDTTFRYESFPSLVRFPNQKIQRKPKAVTLEKTRKVVFYNTEIEAARKLMRMRNDYYYQLIGYEDEAGFSTYDEAMTCAIRS